MVKKLTLDEFTVEFTDEHPDVDVPTALVERAHQQYQNAENIAPRNLFIKLSERGVRASVSKLSISVSIRSSDVI